MSLKRAPGNRGKRGRAGLARTKCALAVASALVAGLAGPALGAPTGGQVVAGQAQIGAPVNGSMTINQTSNRAAINWQSFGIGANESVRFNQPSASAIALNRVLGQNPSAILGTLSANGQVFILNPNGVLFGHGAQVNVGGIVASTLGLSNEDFMAGRYTFAKGATAGSVVNQGAITAANGGYVALLGPEARNEGVITATLGTVALAAGERVTLNLNGDSLVSLTVDRGAVNALAENRQLIRADGGQVIMTAKAADSLIRSVVNNEGVIEANTLTRVEGVIRLTGDTVSHTGTIRARGGDRGGDGGLVAVSGKEIVLEGVVDTRAPHGKTGLLALDPNNVEITSGAATLTGATTIAAATLVTALDTSNVVVHTAGTDGEDGDIRISEAVSYTSVNDLSFLAHRHIEANASVQNNGAGDINLIAGWNGTTGFTATPGTQQEDGAVDVAAILAAPTSYGNNDGSVFINKSDGTGAVGVAVGSRHGQTTVAAHDLTLRAGNADHVYAQISHRGTGDHSGAIAVTVSGNMALTAGSNAISSYAQLGHGGNSIDGNHGGNIIVNVAGNLSILGGVGGNSSYAQLGHGGLAADGNHNGDITVTVTGDQILSAGTSSIAGYAQLGHGDGGFGTAGDLSGDITVTVTGDQTLSGGSNSLFAYTQIGHRGRGDHSGAITVTVDGDLGLTSGLSASTSAYAQIGHRASGTDNGASGALDLTVAGETSLREQGGDSVWLLGHRTTAGSVSNADITFSTGTLDYAFTATSANATLNQLFADRFEANLAGGNVTVVATGAGGMTTTGSFVYNSANALNLLSTRDIRFERSVRNNGTGAVNVVAGWDETTGLLGTTFTIDDVLAAAALPSYGINSGSVFINKPDGTGTVGVLVGSRHGQTTVAAHDLTLRGSDSTVDDFAQIGYYVNGTAASQDATGALRVDLKNDLLAQGGAAAAGGAYAQIGHGGLDLNTTDGEPDGDFSGNITVNAGGSLSLTGGGDNAYARIGHGGIGADGNHGGAITVKVGANLSLTGGNDFSYAQIGHGDASLNSSGARTGAVDLAVADETSLVVGGGTNADWRLGHRTTTVGGVSNADIAFSTGTLDYADTGAAVATLNQDFADRFEENLAGGNVTVAATGAGGMTTTGSFAYGSANALNLLSTHDIRFDAGVQNDGTGAVNVVGGWDGATGLSGTSFTVGDVLDGATSYGNSSGSVFINKSDGSGTTGVAVGSRHGETTVAAHDLILRGSDTTVDAFGQLGYRAHSIRSGTVTGALRVELKNDLLAQAGAGTLAYAQAGHGGYDPSPGAEGDGTFSGTITVNAGGSLSLTGSSGIVTYAQIGHGGAFNGNGDDDHSGDIIVDVGHMSLTGGGDEFSYAQIGHGGFSFVDSNSGAITVDVGGGLSLAGGGGLRAYAQLGHGSAPIGFGVNGSHSGAITVDVGSGLSLAGGGGLRAYAQLGHGDASLDSPGNHSGAVDLAVAGETSLVDGAGTNAFWFLGHRTTTANGVSNAPILFTTGTLDYAAGTSALATLNQDFADRFEENLAGGNVTVAATGAGGMTTTGAFAYTSANALNLLSTRDIRFDAGVQNDGTGAVNVVAGWDGATGLLGTTFTMADVLGDAGSYGNNSGSVFINKFDGTVGVAVGSRHGQTTVAAHDLILRGGNATGAFAQLGYRVDGTAGSQDATGALRVDLKNDLLAQGGSISNAYAQLGHGGLDRDSNTEPDGDFSGAITVNTGRHLNLTGGSDLETYAQIGHGGTHASGDHSGTIVVDVTGNLDLTGGSWASSYAHLGHGGRVARGDHSGDITVEVGGGLSLAGSVGFEGWAQLGHGGRLADGNHSGTIDVTVTGNANLAGGSVTGTGAYTQIGHGGWGASGDHGGAIITTIGGNLSLAGGSAGAGNAYAQLGHGGSEADGNHGGAVTVDVGGNLDLAGGGGTGSDSYAQLGHGGTQASGNHSGVITVAVGANLSFAGGSGTRAYTQLGHGGFEAIGNHGGAINLDVGGNLGLAGGTGSNSYAQLGHGGRDAAGDHSGDIMVTVASGDLELASGGGFAYAQLGHGGFNADGNHNGAITVDVTGNLGLVGGTGNDSYAQLGHGGLIAGGTRSGAITVDVGGNLGLAGGVTYGYAQIGHGDASLNSTGTRSGAVDLTVAGETSLVDGGGTNAVWFLGHRTTTANGVSNAPILFTTGTLDYDAAGTSDVATLDQDFADRFEENLAGGNVTVAATGGGAGTGGMTTTGAFVYDSANAFNLLSTRDIRFDSGVQNDGTGAVNVVAGWDGATGLLGTTFTMADVLDDDTSYGNSSGSVFINKFDGTVGVAVGSRHGQTTVAAHDLILRGGNAGDAFAQLGYYVDGTVANQDATGALRVDLRNDLLAQGAGENGAYAQIGHGGRDLDLGLESNGVFSGAITVDVGGNLNLAGGSDAAVYAQLGHGGVNADGNHGGAITVDVGGSLGLAGGTGSNTYAQLGHGGRNAAGDHNGDIMVTVANGGLELAGGTGGNSYAQLGHGGRDTAGDHNGALTVTVASGDLELAGGTGSSSYAQLGHGGFEAIGNQGGAITVDVAGNLDLAGGTGSNTYAQLGHGGRDAAGDHNGDITVTVANGDLELAGGGDFAYAQLGHGGLAANGNNSGAITVEVDGSLSLAGGTGGDAYTQLGHGGRSATGSHGGAITVDVTGNLDLAGGSDIVTYAQLGHGDASLNSSGTRSGAIDLTVAGETSLVDGADPDAFWFLGHRTTDANGVSNADIVFGTATLDSTAGTGATLATLDQAFADRIGEAVAGGDVTVTVNGTAGNNGDIVNDGAWSYDSANALTLIATRDVTLNAAIANAGAGDIVLAAGRDFFNTADATALATAGRWLVYSTSPGASTEDGLTGAAGGTMPRLYGLAFAGNPPSTIAAGNHLVYSVLPATALTVTADNKTKTYGNANPAFTASITGFLTDDGVTDNATSAGLSGNPAFISPAGDLQVAGSPYTITVGIGNLASTAGYGFGFTNGNLTVNQRPVTVTVDAGQTKVYGNANPGAYTFTNTGLGAGVALAGALDRAAGENAGAYAIGQGTLTNANNANYTITFAGSNFGITPRPLSIAADDQARAVGEANPPFTATYTGFAPGEGLGNLTGAETFATAATVTSPTGTYAISPSGLSSGNYAITFVDGVLTVGTPGGGATAQAAGDAISTVYQVEDAPPPLPEATSSLVSVLGSGIRLPEGVQ